MARWIFGFQSLGERGLSDIERLAIHRRANGLRVRRLAFGLLAVIGFLEAIVFLALAAGLTVYWVGTIPCLWFAFWVLGRSSDAEKLALLLRRAERFGTVEVFLEVPKRDRRAEGVRPGRVPSGPVGPLGGGTDVTGLGRVAGLSAPCGACGVTAASGALKDIVLVNRESVEGRKGGHG